MNDHSKKLMEAFLGQLSDIKWKALDEDQVKNAGTKADYQCEHLKYAKCFIELKELQNPKKVQNGLNLTHLVQQQFKGIFTDTSFSCQIPHQKKFPNAELISVYKKFLKQFCSRINSPCRIIFPEDGVFSPMKLLEIQRLNENGEVVKTEFSPPTKSGKFPRGRGKFENFRKLGSKCRIISEGKEQIEEERKIFTDQDRALLEMESNDLEGGQILGPTRGGMIHEASRIRRGIGVGRKQLKKYEKLGFPLGIIFTSSGLKMAEFKDLKEAVFGNYSITFSINSSGGSSDDTQLIYGKDREFQPNKNTTISFVGWLSEENSRTGLKIIHNEFSVNKLPYNFFDHLSVDQYILKYRMERSSITALPTLVHSEKEIEEIRLANHPIIEELKKRYP